MAFLIGLTYISAGVFFASIALFGVILITFLLTSLTKKSLRKMVFVNTNPNSNY